jgi:replication factor C subunit 2/4
MSSSFFAKRGGGGAGAGSSSSAADDGDGGGHAAAAAALHASRALPWVEKYRPRGLNDVQGQEEITRALANAVRSGNITHMLFYGPPGTGKTSTVLAMARDLYGPELMKSRGACRWWRRRRGGGSRGSATRLRASPAC